MLRPTRSTLAWLLSIAVVVGALVAANSGLLTGDAVPIWDASTQFFPYFTLVADFARSGELMLWNPWANAGSPDFIEPQFGALSPLTLGFALVTGGGITGYAVYWLSVWALGGLGMLALGRHLGTPWWGALIVALGYQFGGVLVNQAQHLSHVTSMAFLPWIVWRWDVALERRRWGAAVQAGALWGLSALSGYPGLTILSAAFLAAWGLGRVLFRGSGPLARRSSPLVLAGGLAMVAVVGCLVLAPPYLGFFTEGGGYTDRAGALPKEEACYDNALHPGALATVAAPSLAVVNLTTRTGPEGGLWPYTRPTMTSVWAGAVPLALALFGLLVSPRDARRWWLLAVGTAFLLTAMSRVFPLRSVLYDLVPVTRYFRQSSMFRDYFMVAVAVLGLLGARDLGELLRAGTRTSRLALAGAAGAVLAVLSVVAASDVVPVDAVRVWVPVAIGWGGVLAAGIAAAATRRTALVAGLLVLTAVADGIATQRISQPMVSNRQPRSIRLERIIDAVHDPSVDLTGRGLFRSELYTHHLRGLSATNFRLKVPVIQTYLPLKNTHHLWIARDERLRSTATGSERVFFSARATEVPSTDATFRHFRRHVAAGGVPPLLLHDDLPPATDPPPEPAWSIHPSNRLTPADARALLYRPHDMVLRVTSPQDGWLLVTDRWARSWRAAVDGRPVPVRRANFVFRAVPVPSGTSIVRFHYDPPLIRPLVALSWTALALGLAGPAVVAASRRRRGGKMRDG